MGPKIFAQKFLYTKLVRYYEVILWGFEAKIVFGAKQASNIQSPDFRLSVGQKNQIDFTSSTCKINFTNNRLTSLRIFKLRAYFEWLTGRWSGCSGWSG